jgi:hypothetical protein
VEGVDLLVEAFPQAVAGLVHHGAGGQAENKIADQNGGSSRMPLL